MVNEPSHWFWNGATKQSTDCVIVDIDGVLANADGNDDLKTQQDEDNLIEEVGAINDEGSLIKYNFNKAGKIKW